MPIEAGRRPGRASWRLARIGPSAGRLARLSFGLAIVLSPFRAGIPLATHPIPPLYAGYTDLLVTAGVLAVLATLVIWIVGLAADPHPVDVGPRFLAWPAAALVTLAWVSGVTSIDRTISFENAAELTLLAGLALYVRNEVETPRSLTVPLVVMVGVQALVGLAQVVAQGSVGLAALGELHLDPTAAGVSVVAAAPADRLLRAYGLTDHPNILGGLLAFVLPLLVIAAVGAGRRWATLLAIAFALGALALFATFSRAAWLAAAVAFAVGLAMLIRARLRVAARTWAVAGVGGLLLCAALALPYARFLAVRADVLDPRVPTEVMSSGERAILIGATAAVAAAHPFTGTGLATLPLALLRSRPDLSFDFQPAPVVPLDVAAELGLLGAACYGWLLVAPWLALLRRSRRWTPELVAVSAALAAVTVVGLFDYYTWTFAPGRIWAWLLLGLWAGTFVRATAPRPAAITEIASRPDRPALGAEARA